MNKYMLLYMAPAAAMDEMMKTANQEQQQEGMTKWKGWMDAHSSDITDMGAPLGKNTRVTKDGSSAVRNEVIGYSIIQAESYDDAVKVVQDCPNFDLPGAYIEVMQVAQM